MCECGNNFQFGMHGMRLEQVSSLMNEWSRWEVLDTSTIQSPSWKTWMINVIKVKDCGNQLKYNEFNAWLVTLGIGTKATIICWDLFKYIHILLIFIKKKKYRSPAPYDWLSIYIYIYIETCEKNVQFVEFKLLSF